MPEWEYLRRHPEAAATFNAAMVGMTRATVDAVVSSYDFSDCAVVVDVGGGHGTLLSAVLKAHPQVSGILFDTPETVAGASPLLKAEGVDSRCQLVGGNFLSAVPSGGDAYLLKWIVHDWDDEGAIAILRNCRAAMGERSKVLLVESVLPDGTASRSAELLTRARADINMLVLFGAKERTALEYEALLTAAGFRLATIHPTPGLFSLIEAHPA
jgi:hypothetical protein